VTRRALSTVAGLAALAVAGCGGGGSGTSSGSAAAPVTRTVTTTRVQVVQPSAAVAGGRFNAARIYRRVAPGVVTVVSVFQSGAVPSPLGGGGGASALGSGFVIARNGEIATNAHVVTNGTGSSLRRASSVYVKFEDGNEVPAKIVGADPNADVALIRVDPKGLNLRPLTLGRSDGLQVGAPVAAIGSPFGEPQSLSIGVVSGLNRTIDALNRFSISGAIQTDAAINHGNSGGPLVDANGRVLGINSQIESSSGGGEGVGFAVPIDKVRRSVGELRKTGHVAYAFLGVSTVGVYPQLAQRFGLPVTHGAWLQQVDSGTPADRAGLKAGSGGDVAFQASRYTPGGDIVVAVDGKKIVRDTDLGDIIATKHPDQTVTLTIYRDGHRQDVHVKLAARPDSTGG
jgi:S1-C subfamily serine protease